MTDYVNAVTINQGAIEEDAVFVESFFAIPDDEIESKLHLQSPWLLRLELDRAKMIDCKLKMESKLGGNTT